MDIECARIIPSLLVRSLERTTRFYERLGFARTGSWGDPPTWMELRRDEVLLQFYVEPPQGTPAEPMMSGTLYLVTNDVQRLAERLRGVFDFEWGPEVMSYGMRELAVRDPDGYLIAFTEPVPDASAD